MEIREHGNHLIVSIYPDDIISELTDTLAARIRENPNIQILLTMNESPDELIERMKSVSEKMECELQPSDIQDILHFGVMMSDVHLSHYKGHRNLTSDCMARLPRPAGSFSKDPTKGFNGMPRKRR